MDIGELAREIALCVDEGEPLQGKMTWETDSLRGQGLSITYKYNFLNETARDNITLGRSDPDIDEYSNDPAAKGRALLEYSLGPGLEAIGTNENIIVHKPITSEASKTLESTANEHPQKKLF